jgi:membrane-associated phospholipid phosphatase
MAFPSEGGIPESRATTGRFIRSPVWMIAGPPLLALLLLVWVELTHVNQELFHHFNNLSSYTGPAFWAHVTLLGDGLVCAVLLLPWVRRHPERIWGGLIGAVLMVLVLHSFKSFLTLPRPLAVLPEETVTVIGPALRRGAFPSGHTSTIAVLCGVLALTTRRQLVSWLALGLAVLVGISRMAVGVHWPSDVLAGLALGWVSAWVGLRWAARARWGMGIWGRRILAFALAVSAVVLLVFDHSGYPGVILFQRAVALTCLVWGMVGSVTELGPGKKTPDGPPETVDE